MAQTDRPVPRRRASREIDRIDAEQAAIRRDRTEVDQPDLVVRLADQRASSWPNGTPWLKIPGAV